MKHLFRLTLLFFLLSAISASGQKLKLLLKEKDTITLIQTPIETILESLDNFDSVWVKIEGTYKYESGSCAIFPLLNNTIRTNPRNIFALWTAFNVKIFENGSIMDSLSKLNDKKVRIKGRISKQDQGPLSKFAASIKDIYYIEEL